MRSYPSAHLTYTSTLQAQSQYPIIASTQFAHSPALERREVSDDRVQECFHYHSRKCWVCSSTSWSPWHGNNPEASTPWEMQALSSPEFTTLSKELENLCSAWVKCKNNRKDNSLWLEPLPQEDSADGCKAHIYKTWKWNHCFSTKQRVQKKKHERFVITVGSGSGGGARNTRGHGRQASDDPRVVI